MKSVIRQGRLGLLKCGVALGCLVSMAASLQETSPGLTGILPPEAPYDISIEKFEILGGNWQDWSEETAFLVADLYEKDDLDSAGQAELLEKIDKRLATMRTALGNSSYLSIFDQLKILHGRVVRRVDLAKAALETLNLDPATVTKNRREKAFNSLKASISALQSQMQSLSGGSAWVKYCKAEEVAELTLDAENFVDVLTASKERFASRSTLEESQQKFFGKPAFLRVEKEVDNMLAVWNAPTADSYDVEKLRAELAALVETVERYEERNLTADATAVKNLASTFGASSLDGGDLVKSVLRKHYLNHNVIIQVSEQFLSRMIPSPAPTSGSINESSGGGRTTGSSTTSASMSVDIKSSQSTAELDLVLSGTVRTSTVTVVPDARIGLGGNHTFSARQHLSFDGVTLHAVGGASINVNPNTYTTSINTKADGTLFASKGRQKAQQSIANRRGQINATARNKITNEVSSKFRSEVSSSTAKANDRLENSLFKKLKERNLYPVSLQASSTDTVMNLASTIMPDSKVGGSAPNPGLALSSGVMLQLHESAVNNILDGLGFAGRTMTETEIKTEIEKRISDFTGKEYSFPAKESAPATEDAEEETKEETIFVFAKEDPIRVQFVGNEIHFIIRAGFKREGKEDLGTQVITLPLRVQIEGSKVLIEADTPSVRGVEKASVAQSNAIKKRIRSSFPPTERDRNFELKRDGQSAVRLNLRKISAVNGWLVAEIQ